MNWVTTNIRIPEEDYIDLKAQAARKRISFAAIVRERISKPKNKAQNIKGLIDEMEKLATENAKYLKGVNLSEEVIKMRYEQ